MKHGYGLILTFLWMPFLVEAGDLRVSPLDFRMEDVWETRVGNVFQLETDGRHIYVRSEDSHVVKLDDNGAFLGKTADLRDVYGTHKRLRAFAYFDGITILTGGESNLFFFRDGVFSASRSSELFHVQSMFGTHNGNGFGFDGQWLVLPATRESGVLGVVLDINGKMRQVLGKREEYARPGGDALNAVTWLKGGNHWFGLFKFRPWIDRYDADFKFLGRMEVSGEEINKMEEKLFSDDQTSPVPNTPHFSDFKYWRGHLYVMCRGALFRLDPKTGETRERYLFYGQGDDFKGVAAGENLGFFNFTILDNGKLVLSHPAMLWNHDLWTVELEGVPAL